jgi:hypothetical protein
MDTLARIHIKDLINKDTSCAQPPTVIQISNFAPLRLAKKKHYTSPNEMQYKVSKKQAAKPQGRPFNDSLNARFMFFDTIDDLIADVMNYKVGYLTHITNFQSFKNDGFMMSNSQQLKVKMPQSSQFRMRAIEFEKLEDETQFNVHDELCDLFDTEELSFVKIIRNNKGQLVKFEILSELTRDQLSVNYIKKFITYPRYKSKMKIYLINGSFGKDIWFYNDMRMLIWDLENVSLGDKKILLNNTILKK